MHYKNGREAQAGDQFVGIDTNGKAIGGILIDPIPGADACNGRVLPPNILWTLPTVTIGDCLHVDDAMKVETGKEEETTG